MICVTLLFTYSNFECAETYRYNMYVIFNPDLFLIYLNHVSVFVCDTLSLCEDTV